jgi:hypothetical protein
VIVLAPGGRAAGVAALVLVVVLLVLRMNHGAAVPGREP